MDKVPNWHEYFMNIAVAVSLRSKDSITKVGAILVDEKNHIVGTGYNGMKPGIVETSELWERPIKYQYVIHAERNCIEHSPILKESKVRDFHYKLYTTMHPCPECAALIAEHPIKDIFFLDDKYKSEESSSILLNAGAKIWRLQ